MDRYKNWDGEGNGNPLQCSCLENPSDWGAWWAAVYGVKDKIKLKKKKKKKNWGHLTFYNWFALVAFQDLFFPRILENTGICFLVIGLG